MGQGKGGQSRRSGQGENSRKCFFTRLLPSMGVSRPRLGWSGRGRGGRAARGRNTGWLEIAHCGRLGVLATGQVNRLGKLPPWWGQEGTNGWPLHNLWLSWGQEDELGLSNGLVTLPAPAPYPPC